MVFESILTGDVVLQQIPLSVRLFPPSEITLPPVCALLVVMLVTFVVVTIGTPAGGVIVFTSP